MRTSSSWTALMTCWQGLSLLDRVSHEQRSRTTWVNVRTTPSSTSAPKRAVRISRSASSRSASVSRPRLRRRPAMRSRRSESASNMRRSGYWTGAAGPGAAGLLEDGGHKLVGVERDEVVRPLAHPDQLHRQAELALDGHHDA